MEELNLRQNDGRTEYPAEEIVAGYQPLALAEGLWGRTELGDDRVAMIKQTYLLLSLSVTAAIVGGIVGAGSEMMVSLFSGWAGWILAMVVLNFVPQIALAAREDPVLGVLALTADGFVSGLVLAPVLQLASVIAPDVVPSALLVTALVFAAVTGYVLTTKRTFSAPAGLMTGIFFSIVGVIVLNGFLEFGLLGTLIAGAIGVFGVLNLVYTTSDVLHNPEADSPVPGALMLFAGLFNVFVAALDILLQVAAAGEE